MITTKLFAPSVPYSDNGEFLNFPSDIALRRSFFPHKVDHPAHNNMHMLNEIVKYLTEPGDWICDPMAGSGSMMYTVSARVHSHNSYAISEFLADKQRHLILIELGPYFSELLLKNLNALRVNKQLSSKDVLIFPEFDCIDTLRMMKERFKLLCFSPPYADQLQVGKGHAIYDVREAEDGVGSTGIKHFTYEHDMNLGNMKEFEFNMNMRKVYKACYDAAIPGGYLALIIKDRMKAGKRVSYSTYHICIARDAGWELSEIYRREAIGQVFGHFNKARGVKGVEDEHIIFMQKGRKRDNAIK